MLLHVNADNVSSLEELNVCVQCLLVLGYSHTRGDAESVHVAMKNEFESWKSLVKLFLTHSEKEY